MTESMLYEQLGIIVLALLLNVGCQIFIFSRLFKALLLVSVFLGCLMGVFIFFALEIYVYQQNSVLWSDYIGVLISGLIMYLAVSYFYFHLVNVGESSLRIRILMEVYNSKDGLSLDNLLDRYNSATILKLRIERLVARKQLIFKEDRYYSGRSGLLVIAKYFQLFKKVISRGYKYI